MKIVNKEILGHLVGNAVALRQIVYTCSYTKADYDYYIGVRCILTNLFGSREVLAYVYDKVASYRNKSVHDFIFTLSE